MMGENGKQVLPSHLPLSQLADTFSSYFIDKITAITDVLMSETSSDRSAMPDRIEPTFSGIPLSEFTPVSAQQVMLLVKKSSSKSCSLDPVPTWLLKEAADELVPILTTIINASIREANVPSSMKKAAVRPLLKKTNLNRDNLRNYRPVSNLTYASKILEKVISAQLDSHLQENHIADDMQSAYRRYHSTETALLKVHSDIVSAMDQGSVAILLMLDMSAAFDTINHDILLHRLEETFGITGAALDWMTSHFHERTQRVLIGDTSSVEKQISVGVPQGSVLGPKVYCMYTYPVGEIIKGHHLLHHCYADDTQLYITVKPSANDVAGATARLESCVVDIKSWMGRNFLKVNNDKTELMFFSTKHRQHVGNDIRVQVGSAPAEPAAHVKNLGVIFDKSLSMEQHINAVSRSCRYHLRNISRIRRYLTDDSCRTLVQSLVVSRLDYCNALLCGLPTKLTTRLQCVQNSAARVVKRVPRRAHITPILKELHWLPVAKRIEYKILLYTFKALHNLAPVYLTELVEPYQPTRCLRSQSQSLLRVPKTKTTTYGRRSFSAASPVLWNKLPDNLKHMDSLYSFKRGLKTYLFGIAYP